MVDLTLPLLKQEPVYIKELGIGIEPKKARVDREGFPSVLRNIPYAIGPSLRPSYLPHIQTGETGVIVCSGNFHIKEQRDKSIMVEPLFYHHLFTGFRLCYDATLTD